MAKLQLQNENLFSKDEVYKLSKLPLVRKEMKDEITNTNAFKTGRVENRL